MPSDKTYATQTQYKHCVKSVCIGSFSGPYVPAPENFKYGHFSRSSSPTASFKQR